MSRPWTALLPPLVLLLPASPAAAQESAPSSRPVWSTDLAGTLAAKEWLSPIMVFFTASWCVPCKELERTVLTTPEFARAFPHYRFVKVDIDSPEGKVAREAWEVGPIPDLRFVTWLGKEIGGFVGERSLAGVLRARDAARESEAREEQLRGGSGGRLLDLGGANPYRDASGLLALGEHLLLRPTKRPGIEVLEQAIAADADGAAGVAARCHWLIVGPAFHPVGQAKPERVADAERRLAWLEEHATRRPARAYLLAVRAWLQWHATMRAWSAERRDPRGEHALVLAQDAPLLVTLADLQRSCDETTLEGPGADGLLLLGMASYYSQDYQRGIALLSHFVTAFPGHRWSGEGKRFVAVCERLQAKAESRPQSAGK